MSVPEVLQNIFRKIDEDEDTFISSLKDAVAIQSVSAWPHKRAECRKMAEYVAEKLTKIGAHVEIKEIGIQTLENGETIPLSPVLLGTLTSKMEKIYGHLDVQPALVEDGWDTDPFVLSKKDGKLYGRGSSDDKGPILDWINALETYKKLGVDVPVDIKFLFEGMEENGSIGLKTFLKNEKDNFLKDVDYICITDSRWLGTKKACLTYGLRGVCYFSVEVKAGVKDLHSGVYGGTVHEALTDLMQLLDTLVSQDGKISIPHINDDVAPLTQNEKQIYEGIDFDIDEYKEYVGCEKLLFDTKESLLMHRWRFPSLSIHGIEGAFSEPGMKTIIPSKVVGKFSIRTVPNQNPDKIEKLVREHLLTKHKESGSPNKIKIDTVKASPWLENPSHPQYEAAKKATKYVYGYEPDLIREGSTIPPALMFKEVTGKNVLILPIGRSDDNAHAQNEKIDVENYIQGTKLLAAYLYEMGKI